MATRGIFSSGFVKHDTNKYMSSGSYLLPSVDPVQSISHCSFNFHLYICSCHAVSLRLSTSASMPTGKFCLLLELYYSSDQLVTGSTTHLDSQIFELQIPWYIAWLLVKLSCAHPTFGGIGGLIMSFAVKTMELHPTEVLFYSLLIQWHGVLISQRPSFYYALQNATQIPGADIYDSGDGILTYSKGVLVSWDPGGSVPVLDTTTGVNWNTTQPPFLHLTWDPGGYRQHRLEGKPNLKEGGLSATYLLSTHELGNGPTPLGFGLHDTKADHYIYLREGHEQDGLEWNGLASAGRRG